MDKKIQGALQIVISLIMIYFAWSLSAYTETFQSYGYAGVFVILLITSATLFLPAPGWAFFLVMVKYLQPIPLGIVAGLGSSIGELTGFFAGHGARNVVKNDSNGGKIEKFIQKYDVIAIFVLAAIPNPFFDVAGIAAGAFGINYWRFFIACAAGRIIRYVAVALILRSLLTIS